MTALETFSVGFGVTVPGTATAPPAPGTTVRIGGKVISIGDWVEDKLYSTLAFGRAKRERPGFGHLPGGRYARRWPDVLYRSKVWGRIQRTAVEPMLDRIREDRLFFTEPDCMRIATWLRLTAEATKTVAVMIAMTDFTDCDSEWALANLIDAAVETASKS
jgi:hypothetical protein